jgi:small GTP-binding protein
MLKVVFLGDTNVGKTSLLNCLNGNPFAMTTPTIGAGASRTTQIVDDREWTFVLWDTAGQERYRSLVPMYLRGANYIFFVFDLSNPSSLEGLRKWVDLARTHSPELFCILIGNKRDLHFEVNLDEVREFEQEIGALGYFQVSARTGAGVCDLLPFIARHGQEIEKRSEGEKPSKKEERNEENGCC